MEQVNHIAPNGYMGVSKNKGLPKSSYRVFHYEKKTSILGGFPLFLETPISSWESKGAPPMPPPPRNKALLKDY